MIFSRYDVDCTAMNLKMYLKHQEYAIT